MADEKENNEVKVTGEGSALDVANAEERRIQLDGRKDPDKLMLKDGRSLSDVRRALYEEHTKEGLEATEVQLKRTRELSMAGDPLYDENSKVVMRGASAIVIPPGEPSEVKNLSKPSTPEEKAEEKGTPLPIDFPSRVDLVEGGFNTREKVRAASDQQLLLLPHIGDAALAAIRSAQG